MLTGVVFERAFLFAAELAPNAAATEETWMLAAKDHRLSTVERLSKGRGSGAHLVDFYSGGALVNLRRCELPTYQSMATFAASPVANSVRHLVLPPNGTPKRLKAVAAVALPQLEQLTLRATPESVDEWAEALSANGFLSRLKRLSVFCENHETNAFLLKTFQSARWWQKTSLVCLFLIDFNGDADAALERSGTDDRLRLSFRSYFEAAALSLLQTLPLSLKAVDVQTSVMRPLNALAELQAAALERSASFSFGADVAIDSTSIERP